SRHTRQAVAYLRGRIQQMIDERRASSEEKHDFLSILLRARGEDGSAMPDQQVMDESVTLFGAGHETTATALTWAWYLLARYPAVYERMRQEVDTVLQGRRPVYADLAHLPYTLQVFKETLRLYPPAYAISRVALHDVDLDGYHVHKGETVVVSPYTMHRRPDFFPDPEKFDPERFTPENEKRLPRYAYFPFGAGPRVCIGNYFSTMEGHLLLATLAQHVTFDLMPNQSIMPNPNKTITIRPKYSMRMLVRHRD
nr:cytochrome P450 [Ktedonobacteraceae bacterium]